MAFITTENRVGHFAEHGYSRVYASHAEVTHDCVNSFNSLSRPQAAQRTSKTECRGRWVAAQKPSQKHLAGETSLLGDFPDSNRSCPGPNDTMRETADQIQHSRCQAGPRFSLNQGPVHAGVTVTAAPNGIFRSQEFFCQPQHGLLVRPWEVSLVRRQLQQLAVHVVRNTTGSPLGWISQGKGFNS